MGGINMKNEQLNDLLKEAQIRLKSGLADVKSDPLQLFGNMIEDYDANVIQQAMDIVRCDYI